jgi:CBS domain-containing protein
MSPRAAWRLEQLGFDRVFDYVPGKMDWLSFWLPWEGTARLAGQAVDRSMPTCELSEQVGTVRDRLDGTAWGSCVVVNGARVVMGVLDAQTLQAGGDAHAGEVMTFGPTTVRPSEQLDPLLSRMEDKAVDTILVTSSDGVLIGALHRAHDPPPQSHR